MERESYTRSEIYELLWTEPATKVAQRIGLSDVALGKWCKHYGEAWKWGQLKDAAERWNELSVLREFIKAIKSNRVVLRKNKEELSGWISWAQEQINARDPIYKVASGMSLPGLNEPVRDDGFE